MDSKIKKQLIIYIFILCIDCYYVGVNATDIKNCTSNADCLNHTVTYSVCVSGICACQTGDIFVDSTCLYDCGSPQATSNGNVSAINGTLQGDVATYYCDTGYRLAGNQEGTCTRSGWGEAPTCEFGCLSDANCSTITGSTCNTTIYECVCPESYVVSSDVCVYDCGSPPDFYADGNVFQRIEDGTLEGHIVLYACPSTNYTLYGDNYGICRVGGWSVMGPSCLLDCGTVPTISNGSLILVDPGNTTAGATARVTCDSGYTEGTPNITCLDTGQWEDAYCIVKDCGSPQAPLNGNVSVINGTLQGDVATYHCDTGYKLIGNKESTCTRTGWGGAPTCEFDCGSPQAPSNGNVSAINGTLQGDVATYNCDTGYRLVGNKENTCTRTGWGGAPTCEFGCLSDANCSTITGSTCNTTIYECVCPESYVVSSDVCVYDCGSPPDFYADGNVFHRIEDGTLEGDIVLYACPTNYTMYGDNIGFCRVGGWSVIRPSCLLDCGTVPTISNGSLILIDPGNTTEGATSRVTCDSGYTESTPNITCLDTGQWEDAYCIVKDCGSPQAPLNGNVSVINGTLQGDVATYHCDTGYKLIGNKESSCTKTGWGGAPTCEFGCVSDADCATITSSTCNTTTYECVCPESYVVYSDTCRYDCGSPPYFYVDGYALQSFEIEHATTVGTLEGDWVLYACPFANYTMYGNDIGICKIGGWSEMMPSCIYDCGMVPVIASGTVLLDDPGNSTVGATATVTCDSGYTGSTPNITCLDKSPWENVECIINDCGSLLLLNAKVNDTSTTYGTVVSITCVVGYELNGESVIDCQEDGVWSENFTCQLIDCGSLQLINGEFNEINGSSDSPTTFGTVLVGSCDQGYFISGDVERECLADGNWSGNSTCTLVDCGSLMLSNAQINDTSTTYGTVVSITCAAGYELNGESVIDCEEDGFWSGNFTCQLIDCGSFLLSNAQVNDTSTTYGTVVSITCTVGYELNGKPVIDCQEDGVWSGNFTCQLIDCGSLQLINGEFNEINGSSDIPTTFGTVLVGSCDQGYFISGDVERECLADGNWSGNSTCTLVDCGSLMLSNAQINDTSTTYGTVVSITCAAGYDLNGESVIDCEEDSFWSGNFTCQLIDCGSLTLINGDFNGSSDSTTTYGTVLVGSCKQGYFLSGDIERECLANGNWSGNSTCKLVDCGSLFLVNGEFNDSSTTYGTVLVGSCNEGYYLSGDIERECFADGNWSGNSTCTLVVVCTEVMNNLCQSEVDAWQEQCCRDKKRNINCNLDCGSLVLVNGKFNDSSTTYGTVLVGSCNEGYFLSGNIERECLADGNWSGNSTCTIVDCGPLSNAQINDTSTTYGKVVLISCDEGYELNGESVIGCQEDGFWSGNFTCKLIDCGSLSLTNGEFNGSSDSSTTYGTVVAGSCDQGYFLSGDIERECLADGNWSGNSTCTLVDCGSLMLSNAQINDTSTTFGTVVSITCSDGYEVNGESVIDCQEDGVWSGNFTCQLIDCGSLLFSNVQVNDTSTTYGTVVSITCAVGYELNGESEIGCQKNGFWSGNFTCQLIDCFVPEVTNGEKAETPNGTTFNETAKLSCEDGYTLNGNASVTCQANGNWTTLPSCDIKNCDDPTSAFSSLNDTNFDYGAVLEMTCNSGYNIVGSATIICQADGTWSGSPTCDPLDCGTRNVTNGQFNASSGTTLGQTATQSCNTGYTLSGEESVVCTASGWNATTPTCTIVDCLIPEVTNGDKAEIPDGTTFNETAKLDCEDGYTLNGNVFVICQATGNWTTLPSCDIKNCGDPTPAFGSLNDTNFDYGTVVEITCDSGYNIIGNATIICQADGTWSASPVCDPSDCGTRNITNGQFYASSGTTLGQTATQSCNTGYTFSGEEAVVCTASGWNATAATCTIVDCSTPEVLNARTAETSNGTTYNQIAKIYCEDGYTLKGNASVTCQANGNWTILPACDIINCGDPTPPYGTANDSKFDYGAVIEISCANGYNIVGNATIVCQADGNWSDSPTCEPFDCETRNITNGQFDASSGTKLRQTATQSCNTGYTFSGEEIVICTASGWNATTATCTLVDCLVPEVNNGEVAETPNGTTFKEIAIIACKVGYTLNGNASVTCEDNGNWTALPSCDINNCGDPSPASGAVNNTNFDYGSVIEISCEKGYNIVGNATILCQADGSWNDSPTCVPFDCGTRNISNGNFNVTSGTRLGQTATQSCNTGYIISGEETIVCTDSGWNATAATCIIVECKAVLNVSHGKITLIEDSNTTYGAFANVTCEMGYNTSTELIQCLDTGAWEAAICDVIECGDPTPSFGITNGTNFDYGAVIGISCEYGYNIVGNAMIVCQANGTWSESPKCDPLDCGELEDPSNGSVDISQGTKFGASAIYMCENGLTLVGDEIRNCEGNGKWGDMEPVCVQPGDKQCSDETDIRGTVWKEVIAGKVRTYNCGQGFTGIASRNCTEDGTWEIPQYSCMHEAVTNVAGKVYSLNANSTQQDFLDVINELESLTRLKNITNHQDKLTDGDIKGMVDSLGLISRLLKTSPDLFSPDIADAFIGSASHLVDATNIDSWRSLSQTDNKVAETMLTAVGTLGDGLGNYVDSSGKEMPAVVTKNIALQVKKVSSNDFIFPESDADDKGEWLDSTNSKVQLNPASLQGKDYVGIAAMYKDLSDILPDKSQTEKLNGQTMSFSTWPKFTGTIDPPITLTFQHTTTDFTKPSCAFWKFQTDSQSYWSADGCNVTALLNGVTECECNHLTDFAILLSLQDCGSLENPTNGKTETSTATSYNSTAKFKCIEGYTISGSDNSVCLFNGSWSSNIPDCIPKDCGSLENPKNGNVDSSSGTVYRARASYSCNDGYSLQGSDTRICLANGSWSLPLPVCTVKESTIIICEENVDSRQFLWTATQAGNTRNEPCDEGFSGLKTRTCRNDGTWQLPQYDCVRDSVQQVSEKVDMLDASATEDDVSDVLKEVTKVSELSESEQDEERLTDGELGVLAATLQKVADILASSSYISNDNITEDFLESTSSLLDESNKESWKSLSESDSNEAERVLQAVDSLAEALSKSIKSSEEDDKIIIVKKNLALEVKKFGRNDLIFPSPDEILGDEDEEDLRWIKESQSHLRLDSKTLKNETIDYVTTTVMYRDMSDILPTKTVETSEDAEVEKVEDIINAPTLALKISPPVTENLNPPLMITFHHKNKSLTTPTCVFWKFRNESSILGYWSTDGSKLVTTNENFTVCEFDHLTNFACLMSPFIEADASSKALRIISIVGIGISIACLIATFSVHFFLWKYLRTDRTAVLMNLCIALLISYVIFLGGVDRTESSVACAAIAAILQYIYLVVFCIMLVEGIEVAVLVLLVFKRKSRIKIKLVLAWVVPVVIVGISLGVTKAEGYGNDSFCWLSVDKGLIWAFVGPAVLIITFNGICLIITIRVMFRTRAMKSKKATEKIKTSFRSLCVLVPLMGVSWILGILYINDSFYFIQYIFAILNGLQGFFIFLFHCLLNAQVKKAIRSWSSRRASLQSTLRDMSKEERNTKDLKEMVKSYRDVKNIGQGSSDGTREKQQYSPEVLKFTTPLGFYGTGRRASKFTVESRDSLTGDRSTSLSKQSQNVSQRLQTQLFANKL